MRLGLKQNINGYCVAVGVTIELRNDPVIDDQFLLVNAALFSNNRH